MKIRTSPIHNFIKEHGAPFDLYLRYLACKPRDGLEFEFFQDENQTTEADVQLGASSDAQPGALPGTQLFPSPNARRVPPAKYEEGASVASDKENRPPANDNPSNEDS